MAGEAGEDFHRRYKAWQEARMATEHVEREVWAQKVFFPKAGR
jgi:hypothetical protein